MGLRFAKEQYINNNFEVANRELLKLQSSCEKISADSIEILNSEVFCTEVVALILRLNSNLDYFSKELSWIPSLSLESNFMIYRKEIKSAFKTIYLSKKVSSSIESIQEAIEAVKTAKSETIREIDQNIIDQRDLLGKVPSLEVRINELKKQQEVIIEELEKFEKDIIEQATRNVELRNKVPFIKKAVNTMAAISRVIPAGNPLFSNIASSLSNIVNVGIGEMRWQDWLKTFPDELERFSADNIRKNVDDWNRFREQIDLSEYERIVSQRVNPADPDGPTEESINREKREYFNKLKLLLLPLSKEILELSKAKSISSVSKSEIENEISKLKNLHPLFIPLTQKLSKLVSDKQNIIRDLNDLNNSIHSISVKNANLFLRATELADNYVNLQDKNDPYLLGLMRDSQRSAEELLEKYNYYLYKAYTYRMLEPFPGRVNLVPVYEKIRELVERGEDFDERFIEEVQSIHNEQLSKVTERLSSLLNNGSYSTFTTTRVHKLTPVELKMLNDGEVIYLDLLRKEILGNDLSEEVFNNLRVVDVRVMELDFAFNEDLLKFGEGTISVGHDGDSYLSKDGRIYQFSLNDRPFVWRKTKDFASGFVSFDTDNRFNSERSILGAILNDNFEKRYLFARPGGIGHLNLKLDKRHNPEADVNLKNVVIKITFESEMI